MLCTLAGRYRGVSVRAVHVSQVHLLDHKDNRDRLLREREVLTRRAIGKHGGTLLTAGHDGGISRALTARADSLRLLAPLVPRRDERIGDAAFDHLVELEHLNEYGCAGLSHPARQLLVEL